MRAWEQGRFRWRVSSYSGGDSGNCVEIGRCEGVTALRDSKQPEGGILLLTAAAWRAFRTTAARGGR